MKEENLAQQEGTDVATDEQLQVLLLDLMKHTVSDADGNVPEMFQGAFERIQTDSEGNPTLQLVAGIIVFAGGNILYSPNVAVDAESISVEIVNVLKLLTQNDRELIICAGHFIDESGVFYSGDEARKFHMYMLERAFLDKIKKMKDENDTRLILPNGTGKIITK